MLFLYHLFILLHIGFSHSHPNSTYLGSLKRLPSENLVSLRSNMLLRRHNNPSLLKTRSIKEEDYIEEPSFDNKIAQTVTAVQGKTSEIICKVFKLGNKTVSWLRQENLHIISAGLYTFTSDQRFQALYYEHSSEWVLRIRNVQSRDKGTYECQINTQPVKSFFVYLNVVVPVVTILGPSEIFLDAGSTINVTCVVNHSPVSPHNLIWFHQEKPIDYTSTRGGVSVLTNKAEATISSLIIHKARVEDGGQYSCKTKLVEPVSVKIHVLTGDNLRSLHTNTCGTLLFVTTWHIVAIQTVLAFTIPMFYLFH